MMGTSALRPVVLMACFFARVCVCFAFAAVALLAAEAAAALHRSCSLGDVHRSPFQSYCANDGIARLSLVCLLRSVRVSESEHLSACVRACVFVFVRESVAVCA